MTGASAFAEEDFHTFADPDPEKAIGDDPSIFALTTAHGRAIENTEHRVGIPQRPARQARRAAKTTMDACSGARHRAGW